MRNKKKKPFYLNWVLWVAVSTGLILLTSGLLIAFGPAGLIVPIVVMAGVVSATAEPVIRAWGKIKDGLEELKEGSRREGERNTKIEGTAVLAATTALALSNTVAVNTERSELLEKRYEILSDMAYQLTENLQQESVRSERKIALLEQQIAALKAEIRKQGEESTGDKLKITSLQNQIDELQAQLNKFQVENEFLRNELKKHRGSDQLPALASGDTVRLELISSEEKEKKDDGL